MKRQRKFLVTGHKPVHSKQANDLLKAFDLGIEGAFVPLSDLLTATLNPDVTQEQLDRQPIAIQNAYEQAGCIEVRVQEVDTNAK